MTVATMPIGIYNRSLPDGDRLDARGAIAAAHAWGLAGCLFASPLALSPTLDLDEIREITAFATDIGLDLTVGVGRIHPFRFDREAEVLALGGGDFRAGLARLARAAVATGCRELWFSVGTLVDRFDRSVPWALQLAAVESFLTDFAPVLRDIGCRLNLKTHEENTTFEIVRLVEAVGPDVLGISLDPVNVLVRIEDPVAAARRIAPYVQHVHVDDALIYPVDDGVERKLYPLGEGIIDWPSILAVLAEQAPATRLWIELHRGQFRMALFDPTWLAAQPDLTSEELAAVMRLAVIGRQRLASGAVPPPDTYQTDPARRLRPTLNALRSLTGDLP